VNGNNIKQFVGKPFHSMETLTPKGLSYAPGSSPGSRISWTVSKTSETKGLFGEESYVIASSGSRRMGFSYTIGTTSLHELPSMSFTPYGFAPTRFYRFGPTVNYSSGFSLLPSGKFPTGIITRIRRVFEPPTGSYESIAKWSFKQPKGSWSVISPKMYMGGPETELNVFGKTVLKRYLPESDATLLQRFKGYQYYADVPLQETGFFSGKPLIEKVPVVFTKPVHKGFPSGVKPLLSEKTNINRFKNLVFGSSTSESNISLINPKTILASKPSYFESVPSLSIFPSPPSIISISSRPSYPSSSSMISSIGGSSISSRPSYPSYPSIPNIPIPPSYTIRYYKNDPFKLEKHKDFIKDWSRGYRYRQWKTPQLKQLFGGI
jgi:hypothetical protein